MKGTSDETSIPLQAPTRERDPNEGNLIQAAKRGNWGVIEKLIEIGTDVNCEDEFQMRPIHYAAAYGRTAIFEKLMMNGGIKLMPSLWNCLDLAIDNEHEETVIKMLSIDTVDWENMMISKSWVDQQSGIGFIDTPFRKLIRNMPDVARLVLNKYTTIEGSKEFKVLFDFTLMDIESRLNMQCCNRYTFIASENGGAGLVRCAICNNQMQNIEHDTKEGLPGCPAFCSKLEKDMDQGKQYFSIFEGKTPIKENHPLVIMVKCKRKELLYHPLVSAYLKRTWKPTGIIAISAYFTLYAVFLALLTGFTLSLKAPYQFNRNSSSNTSNCTDTVDHIPAFASKAKYALHVLAPIEIIIEITVLCIMYWKCGWKYGAKLKRFCDLATYISALLFIYDTNDCHDTGFRKDQFSTFGRSLVKTISMMIGEIDFKTTLYDEYVNFEFLSFVFFSIFMLLMPIVVVNLLVGLAVEDIHACKRNASLEKRRLQVDLMLEFTMSSESKYSWSPFSLPVPDSTTLIIPKNQGFIKKMWDSAWKLTEHDIKSGLKPEKDRIFKLERKLNKLRKYMKKQMETTREILERLK